MISVATLKVYSCHHNLARRYWRDYFPEVSGIVFMVDSSEMSRFDDCRKELQVRYLFLGLGEFFLALLPRVCSR